MRSAPVEKPPEKHRTLEAKSGHVQENSRAVQSMTGRDPWAQDRGKVTDMCIFKTKDV